MYSIVVKSETEKRSQPGAASTWKEVDAKLVELAGEQSRREYELGQWMLAAERERVHVQMGFRSLVEYFEHRLGKAPLAITERLRTARCLKALPRIADEMIAGRMHYSVVRELTRVATADTEQDWIVAVRGRSARQVEAKVVLHHPGDRPDDPEDPALARHRMLFTLTAEEYATVKARFRQLREGDRTLTDGELLAMVCRGGVPVGDGSPPFHVEVHVDAEGDVTMSDGGGRIDVPPDVAERALCDAQVFEIDRTRKRLRKRSTIRAAVARDVFERAKGRCEVCRACLDTERHHIRLVSEGGGDEAENLVLLCGAHHTRVHAGTLRIEGDRKSGLVFLHADGTPYGMPMDGSKAERYLKAFDFVRARGHRETETRQALKKAIEDYWDRELQTPNLIREALRNLGDPVMKKKPWEWPAEIAVGEPPMEPEPRRRYPLRGFHVEGGG